MPAICVSFLLGRGEEMAHHVDPALSEPHRQLLFPRNPALQLLPLDILRRKVRAQVDPDKVTRVRRAERDVVDVEELGGAGVRRREAGLVEHDVLGEADGVEEKTGPEGVLRRERQRRKGKDEGGRTAGEEIFMSKQELSIAVWSSGLACEMRACRTKIRQRRAERERREKVTHADAKPVRSPVLRSAVDAVNASRVAARFGRVERKDRNELLEFGNVCRRARSVASRPRGEE